MTAKRFSNKFSIKKKRSNQKQDNQSQEHNQKEKWMKRLINLKWKRLLLREKQNKLLRNKKRSWKTMLSKANQRRKQLRLQLSPLEEVLEFNQSKLLWKDRKNEILNDS